MAGITPIASQHEKRIALFTGAFNHVVDGVSLTLNRLVSYLETEGTPVHVFAPTVENPPIKHAGALTGVPSIKMPGRPEYRISIGMNPAAIEQLDRFRPTIVHIATPDLVGLQALLYARVQKIPVVASYHTHFSSYLGFYDLDRFESTMWWYLRWFYSRCEHLYVPSLSMVSVLKEHGIQKGIELWPRGVDIVAFNPNKRSMEWRRELGFTDDMVVISYISRLVIEKGLDVFADVVRRLLDEGMNVRSLIVGEGPVGKMLKEKLPEAVFLGHLQGEELSVAYASSDLFLFPSETETFGNVTLEAMASGLPTLCADATGSNSLVLHDRTGFLAKGRDTESFANYAKILTLDTSRRLQMGSAARSEAETYSWRRILGKIDSFYDQILQLPERD